MYISLYVQNVRWCFLLSVCVRCKWLSPTIRRTDSRSSDFFLLLFLPLSPALSVPPHTICAQPSQTFVLYPFYILSSSLSCMHGTQFGGRAEHTHTHWGDSSTFHSAKRKRKTGLRYRMYSVSVLCVRAPCSIVCGSASHSMRTSIFTSFHFGLLKMLI